MKSTIGYWALVWAVFLGGCAAAPPASDHEITADTMTQEERNEVVIWLETRGIKPESIEFVDTDVFIGDDWIAPISQLLTASRSLVEKGYEYLPIGGSVGATNIKLTFGTSGLGLPSAAWQAAARIAAADWSAAATDEGQDIAVDIDEANTGAHLIVTLGLIGDPCVYAHATIPHGFNSSIPGEVTINSLYNCGSCGTYATLATTTKNTVMRHEMGHALGMAHPEDLNDSGVTHIPNTKYYNPAQPYSTVMHANLSCGTGVPLLDDDRHSLFEMYGAD